MKSPMLTKLERDERKRYIKKTALEITVLIIVIGLNVLAAIY